MYSISREDSLAQFVVVRLLPMHFAIYFDREFRCVAIEVDDVSRDHLLTAEVKTIRRISPQSLPEPARRQGHFTAELLCQQKLLRLNDLTAYDLSASIHKKDRNLTP
jgi:hypothetical protein